MLTVHSSFLSSHLSNWLEPLTGNSLSLESVICITLGSLLIGYGLLRIFSSSSPEGDDDDKDDDSLGFPNETSTPIHSISLIDIDNDISQDPNESLVPKHSTSDAAVQFDIPVDSGTQTDTPVDHDVDGLNTSIYNDHIIDPSGPLTADEYNALNDYYTAKLKTLNRTYFSQWEWKRRFDDPLSPGWTKVPRDR